MSSSPLFQRGPFGGTTLLRRRLREERQGGQVQVRRGLLLGRGDGEGCRGGPRLLCRHPGTHPRALHGQRLVVNWDISSIFPITPLHLALELLGCVEAMNELFTHSQYTYSIAITVLIQYSTLFAIRKCPANPKYRLKIPLIRSNLLHKNTVPREKSP